MLDVGGSRCGNVGRCECGKGARGGRILPRVRGIPHVRENWPYFAPNLASLGRSFEGLLPRVIKFVRSSKGGTRFGRRVDDKVGIVAELTKGLCQKAEVAVPEKLVRADGEVGVKKDFQGPILLAGKS